MATPSVDFQFVAGRLCLDFVNTEVLREGQSVELLGSYQALVEWARRAGALDPGEADFVLERWGTDVDEAAAALAAARALRGQLRDVAQRMLDGLLPIPPEALTLTNEALRSRPGYLQLERSGAEWAARWKVPLRRADDVLWRIARSAASLVADDEPALVRRCERESCGLFFYDTTKNHRKRFCRMEVCGAAVRSAAYYRRRSSR